MPTDDRPTHDRPTADVTEVLDLGRVVREVDGVAALSEAFVLALTAGTPGHVHLVARTDEHGELVGYAQVNPEGAVELVVHPEARRRGHARALWTQALGRGARTAWAHGDLPAARATAAALGLERVRELHRMERPLTVADREPVVLPDGFSTRTFVPGQDDESWVALNAAAFVHHPEQGRLTLSDLHERIALPWFDAAGFFLVTDDAAPERGPIAFHWTKIEPEDDPDRGEAPNSGEVYVVGVHPAYQGRGLARPLTRLGTHHLAERGCRTVELYVDGDNVAALATYRREGFDSASVDVMYAAHSPG